MDKSPIKLRDDNIHIFLERGYPFPDGKVPNTPLNAEHVISELVKSVQMFLDNTPGFTKMDLWIKAYIACQHGKQFLEHE